MLIGPNGTKVNTGNVFTITRSRPGELGVENRPSQSALAAHDRGVYTCRIPLQSGDMRDINIGVYPSGFNSEYLFLSLFFMHRSKVAPVHYIISIIYCYCVQYFCDWTLQPLIIS